MAYLVFERASNGPALKSIRVCTSDESLANMLDSQRRRDIKTNTAWSERHGYLEKVADYAKRNDTVEKYLSQHSYRICVYEIAMDVDNPPRKLDIEAIRHIVLGKDISTPKEEQPEPSEDFEITGP